MLKKCRHCLSNYVISTVTQGKKEADSQATQTENYNNLNFHGYCHLQLPKWLNGQYYDNYIYDDIGKPSCHKGRAHVGTSTIRDCLVPIEGKWSTYEECFQNDYQGITAGEYHDSVASPMESFRGEYFRI